jgi:AraC-like DNA-binding protein
MERAAELLAEDRLTVRAIAKQLGFGDPFYFSRTFRRHFGRSPSEYRDATAREGSSRQDV